jgi:hypothetical protein
MDKRSVFSSVLVGCALAACAAAALAGPYDQPYSIIVTDTKKSSEPKLRPVIVNRVDGENTLNNEAVVAPGKHRLTLDLPPRKGFSLATQNEMDLETQACTRYYVAARLRTQTGQEWEPVLRYSEPIGECKAKFGGQAGKAKPA